MTNRILCIFGHKGYGKSYLTKNRLLGHWSRLLVFDTQREYSDGLIVRDPVACLDWLLKKDPKRFRIIARPQTDWAVSVFLKLAWILEDLLVVCEEVDLFTSAQRIHPDLSRLVKYGRHRGIDLIAIARRPAEISRHLTAQADLVLSFRQEEPRDLEYFAKISKENSEALQTLKVGEYKILRKAPGLDNLRL
jgi:hypothetical protein